MTTSTVSGTVWNGVSAATSVGMDATTVVPAAPVNLRDVMKEQEDERLQAHKDALDEELQHALKLSAEEAKEKEVSTEASAEKMCPRCTFLNKAMALACEICGTFLQQESQRSDEDLAVALQLQDEEMTKASRVPMDLSHERDPLWKAKHQPSIYETGSYVGYESLDEEAGDEYDDEVVEDTVRHQMRGRRGCGVDWIRLPDGSIITKHDAELNGRENARLACDTLSGMGNLVEEDFLLPNTAYNSLRKAVRRTEGVVKGVCVKGKVSKEELATREGVLDRRTRKLLWRLINKGALEEVYGVVKTGKESRVYLARGIEEKFFESCAGDTQSLASTELDSNPDLSRHLSQWDDVDSGEGDANVTLKSPLTVSPLTRDEESIAAERIKTKLGEDAEAALDAVFEGEATAPLLLLAAPPKPTTALLPPRVKANPITDIAVKVFFTTLDTFSNRAEYVVGDHRYGPRFVKKTKRQMINAWAEKEYRNLIRVHRVGIACPRPLYITEHCLLMSFLGKEGWPAPQLHELARKTVSPSLWRKIYLQSVGIIRDMWQHAGLVHGDMSEYNLLFWEKRCCVIDLGQSTTTGNPDARQFLQRDIENILTFFTKRKVAVHSMKSILMFVTEKTSFKVTGVVSGQYDVDGDGETARELASIPGSEQAVLSALDSLEASEAAIEDGIRTVFEQHQEQEGDEGCNARS